jgi:hypothetical protein
VPVQAVTLNQTGEVAGAILDHITGPLPVVMPWLAYVILVTALADDLMSSEGKGEREREASALLCWVDSSSL